MRSAYNLVHALAATTILVAAVLSSGFPAFWRQFLHGLSQTMTPQVLAQQLGFSTAFFGVLILLLWGTTFIPTATRRAAVSDEAPDRRRAVKLALAASPILIPVALGLNWLGANLIEWIAHVKPADQELVKCFIDPHYSFAARALLAVVVLFQAPVLEELLFRGIIFRGFRRNCPSRVAILLSAVVFAFVHVNAASLVALVFLGAAFAWLYERTQTILAPMTAHFVFNAANVLLLIFFPDLAT